MKKINLFFISFLFFCFACQEEQKGFVPISGTITNMVHDSIVFVQGDDITSMKVDETGHYSGEIKNKKGYATFMHSKYPLSFYLESDKPLVINFDAKEPFKNLEFEGEGSGPSNYLAEKNVLLNNLGGKMRDLFSMDESAFVKAVNTEKDLFLKLLSLKEGFSSQFIEKEKINLDYEFASLMREHEPAHKYFTKDANYESSDTFKALWATLDIDNEAYFKEIPSYNSFVSNHYSEIEMPAALDSLNQLQSSYIKSSVAQSLSEYVNLSQDDVDGTFDLLSSLAVVDAHKTAIDERYTKIKSVSKGSPSPQFDYENVKGQNVKLEDLKGKNVYIDVWATWCGPCIAEIPSLKKLESDYQGKNIEFVSISVDEPENKTLWKETVVNRDLKGVQLITEAGWNTEFIQNYLINGIPRFILLDAEGKIVSADAPRPSSDALIKEMIDELL